MLTVIGTFLPLIGVVATAVFGRITSGRVRWIVLVSLPAITLAASFVIAPEVGKDGNLLFVLLLLGLAVALTVYYPVLVVIAIRRWVSRRR